MQIGLVDEANWLFRITRNNKIAQESAFINHLESNPCHCVWGYFSQYAGRNDFRSTTTSSISTKSLILNRF